MKKGTPLLLLGFLLGASLVLPSSLSFADTGQTTTTPPTTTNSSPSGTTSNTTNTTTTTSPTTTNTGTNPSSSTTAPTNSVPSTNLVSYTYPIKVDLSHFGDVSVTLNGTYQVVNLDNQSLIQVTGPFTCVIEPDASGLVWIHGQGIDRGSKLGFAIQELAGTQSGNYTVLAPVGGTKTYPYRGSLTISPNKIYNTLSLTDYLKGVVAREMPSNWPAEALKAQSVAARNYAYNQMQASGFVYDDQRSQVYGGMSAENPSTNAAVDATKGLIMYDGSKPITAYFSSSNGGHTALGSEVWLNDLPYLTAKADPFDSFQNPYTLWSVPIPNATIIQKLGLTPDDIIVKLAITKRTNYGRAQQVMGTVLNTQTQLLSQVIFPSGTTPDGLRSAFGQSLRSTMFNILPQQTSAQVMMADGSVQTVDYLEGNPIMQADGSTMNLTGLTVPVNDATSTFELPLYAQYYTFNGSGNGHGVGLSQYGAYGMAAAGKTYQDILNFYYTGITFKVIGN